MGSGQAVPKMPHNDIYPWSSFSYVIPFSWVLAELIGFLLMTKL